MPVDPEQRRIREHCEGRCATESHGQGHEVEGEDPERDRRRLADSDHVQEREAAGQRKGREMMGSDGNRFAA